MAYQGRDAVIVGAVRTPVGKGKASGALHDVLPADLLAHSLRELVARTGVEPGQIDDVIAGAVTQVGDQAVNIARNALLGAGFPESVPGTTVDRQCGSSQQAISFAAQGVVSGAYDLVIAAGVESMSRVPMGSSVLPGSNPFGNDMTSRYPEGLVPQGISAELIAAKWGFSRSRARRVLGRQPREGGAGHQGRTLRQRAGPDRRAEHRRDHPARYHRRDPGRAEAGLLRPGGPSPLPADQLVDHAGQLVAAVRRQRRGADHQRRGRQETGPAAAGPDSHRHGGGLGSALHADRRYSGHREGVTTRRSDAGRHRPVRGQRGVRTGRAGLGHMTPGPIWPRPTSTAARSRSDTRWAPAALAS